MNGSGRNKEKIARRNGTPRKHMFQRSIECHAPQGLGASLAAQPQPDHRARLGFHHKPAFRLSTFVAAQIRLFIIRMNLNRQLLTGKKVFREKRQTSVADEPNLTNGLIR